jgi:hypothetical protein
VLIRIDCSNNNNNNNNNNCKSVKVFTFGTRLLVTIERLSSIGVVSDHFLTIVQKNAYSSPCRCLHGGVSGLLRPVRSRTDEEARAQMLF